MRHRVTGVLAFILVISSAESQAAEWRFRFAETPSNEKDLYLWPANLHLGAIGVGDTAAQTGGAAIGLELMRFSYKALVIDTASIRLAFRDSCAGLSNCGTGTDVMIGPRVFYAAYADDDRNHRFLFGGGPAYGQVAGGFSGRPSGDVGQLLVTPAIAYEFLGLFGLEVGAILPLTRTGDRYPVAVTVSVLGLGSVMALLAGKMAFW